MNPTQPNRRDFVKGGAAALAALGAMGQGRRASANERFTCGVMGVRGRGGFWSDYLARRPEVDVAYVCDVDAAVAEAAANAVEKACGRRPKVVGDFRHILDDKNVDFLTNATPDHWHALPTIMACQAGKDVYVEKPASHTPFEGRQMIAAARKYDRVVQLGTQTRSGRYTLEALEYIRSGKLGRVHFIRVFNMKTWGGIGRHQDEAAPPKGVDYDMWLGPAPMRPFNQTHFHGGWYFLWNYSGGDIINDGVHQLDIARMFTGEAFPSGVTATGGRYDKTDDDAECPDTMVVNYEFPNLLMTFEMTLWTPHMVKTTPEMRESLTEYPEWRTAGERIEVHGTNGMMMFGRHGAGWQVYGADAAKTAEGNGPVPLTEHFDNFLDCIRTRRRPNADIEEGHRSTLLAQLGNISQRVGGRRLGIDPKTGDILNDDEANGYVKRVYREPWVIRDQV